MTENKKECKSVGERLLELRNQNNMTQEELAEHLEVSRQSVSKWELNKTLPDVEKLILLADRYQVSMDYLIRGEMGEKCKDSVSSQENEGQCVCIENAEDTRKEEAEKKEAESRDEGYKNQKKEISASSLYNIYRRTAFLFCAIVSCFLCIGSFFFAGRLILTQASGGESKEQSLLYVDRIYEQYTRAEVYGTMENGEFIKKIMWLDVPGVREEDYLHCYLDAGQPKKVYFEYYVKTLLFPVIVGILFLIFFIVFFVEWKNTKAGSKE